jgi:predicted aldo/keto reductase-like oxidoreductase
MIFSSVNSVSLFEDLEGERAGYNIGIELKHTARASECSECGQCEGACPQHIEVIKEMASAARMFD